MGKLRSPASPPTRATETPTTFPRMDPPPPYEASASSRSTSAHSHDRLQAHPREGSPQEQHQQQPSPAQPEAQSDSLEMQGPATQQKGLNFKTSKTGCCQFGEK